jgi:hypothetical protein
MSELEGKSIPLPWKLFIKNTANFELCVLQKIARELSTAGGSMAPIFSTVNPFAYRDFLNLSE